MKIARENSSPDEYNIKTMSEVLRELMGEAAAFPGGDIMLVISSNNKAFGAYGVIALKDQLKERFPEGYIVLPSSLHEVIVIPKGTGELIALAQMVQEVNHTEVNPEEILGHKAYEIIG